MEPGQVSTQPTSTAPAATASSEELARKTARVALGAFGLAAKTISGMFRTSVREREAEEEPSAVDLAALATWTALWAGAEVLERVLDAAGGAASRVSAAATSLGKGPLRGPTESVRGKLLELSRQGREKQKGSQEEAREFLVSAVGQVVNGVLDQIDLNEVIDQVDVDAIVARVDINKIARGIDVDAIVARVDINKIARGIDVDAIVARVDINKIAEGIDLDALASRIDLNKIAERIDMEAIIRRLDLAAIAKEVMDELEVNELIRESAGSMTTETVDALRVQGVNADRLVSRIVDRILRRGEERDLGLPHESLEPNGQDHR